MGETEKKPQHTKEDRNFRSNYYEKVGFHEVDTKKMVETLFNEDPIDLDRCCMFCIKFMVPLEFRLSLWRMILDLDSKYSFSRSTYKQYRNTPYQASKESLNYLNILNESFSQAENLTIQYLWHLRVLNTNISIDEQLNEPIAQDFKCIVEVLDEICNDECEIFMVAINFFKLINNANQEIYLEIKKYFFRLLLNDNGKLANHLEKIGVIDEIPIENWIRKGFVGIIDPPLLFCIWDKVIGGSLMIFVYLILSSIEASTTALYSCQTSQEAIRLIVSTPDETDEKIVHRAIDHWTRDGCHLIPNLNERQLSNNNQTFNANSEPFGMASSIIIPDI